MREFVTEVQELFQVTINNPDRSVSGGQIAPAREVAVFVKDTVLRYGVGAFPEQGRAVAVDGNSAVHYPIAVIPFGIAVDRTAANLE